MTRLYIILLLVSAAYGTKAQATADGAVEYNVVRITDRVSNESRVGIGTITFTASDIKWVQKPGSSPYEFHILGTEGASTQEGDATIAYQVKLREQSGTIVLKRSQDLITVEFFFRHENKEIFPIKFLVSTAAQQ